MMSDYLQKEFGHIDKLSPKASAELQTLLNRHGYNLAVDGIVGAKTKWAFADFKRNHYLEYPHVIGKTTYDKLISKKPQFIKPCDGVLTSPYGYRVHPIRKRRAFHHGIDIANSRGTPIKASASGTVKSSGTLGGYGKTIILSHNQGKGQYETLYAHCDRLKFNKMAYVRQGEVIAFMGSTGMSTGNHLHFEIRKNGKSTNPLTYITL